MPQKIVHFCPGCGQPLPAPQSFSGCPICTCPHCGLEYFDKAIREPGFYPPPKRHHDWYHFWSKQTIVLFATCLLLLGLYIYCGFVYSFPLIPFIFFSLLALGFIIPSVIIFSKENRVHKQACQAYAQSCERIQDKAYMRRLLDYGYSVPKTILQAYHPELDNYFPEHTPSTTDGSIFFF